MFAKPKPKHQAGSSLSAKAAELLRASVKVSEALSKVTAGNRSKSSKTNKHSNKPDKFLKVQVPRQPTVETNKKSQPSKNIPLNQASTSKPTPKTTFSSTVTRKKSNSNPTKLRILEDDRGNQPGKRISLTKSDSVVQELQPRIAHKVPDRTEPWVANTMYNHELEQLNRSVSFSTNNPEVQFYEQPPVAPPIREFVAGSPPPEPSNAEPHGPTIHFDDNCVEMGTLVKEPLRSKTAAINGPIESHKDLQKIIELERNILENQRRHEYKVGQLEKTLRDTHASHGHEHTMHAIKSDNIELQKKNSLMSMEITSLRDQNDALRAENKRLLERQQTHDGNNENKIPLNARDKQLQNEIISQLKTMVSIQESTNLRDNHKLLWNLGYALNSVIQVCEHLEKPSRLSCLLSIQQLAENLEPVLSSVRNINTDYSKLQQSISNLQAENNNLQNTIQIESQHFQSEFKILQDTIREYEHNFHELHNSYELLLQENEEIGSAHDELLTDNKRLVVLLEQLDIPNNLSNNEKILQHLDIKSMTAQIIELKESVQKWQNESTNLLHQNRELKQDNMKKIELEELLEDEKLRNSKCHELIKSLQHQLANPDSGLEPQQHQNPQLVIKSKMFEIEKLSSQFKGNQD